MTGNGFARILAALRASRQERPAAPLLDAAWEDRVMAAVLAQSRVPARVGLLERLEGLAWAAWTAGATAAGVGLLAAMRLSLVTGALDRLSILRTFYTFSPLF